MRLHSVVTFGFCLAVGLVACGDDDDGASDAGRGDASSGGDHAHSAKDSGPHDASTGSNKDASSGDAASGSGASVKFTFKAVVGTQPFACGTTYSSVGSTKLNATPKDFRFFVQDFKLLTRNGDEVPVEIPSVAPFQDTGVALIDFTDGKGECGGDAKTNVEITGTAPAGDYDGIVFSVGVPETLNHQNVVTANPPLQNPALNWGWLNGYRFLLAEIDVPGLATDDAGTDDGGVSSTSSLVHTGSGGCAGSTKNGFQCSRPNRNLVRLSGFDPRKQPIVVDLGAIFAQTDLRLAKQCHGAEPGCENMFQALGIDMATGAPLETQDVFRTK